MVDVTSTTTSSRQIDDLLPRSATLVDAFQTAGEVVADDPVVQSAARLAAHHRRQWEAEDDSRNAVDVHGVARAKRSIDQLNQHRVQLVERIDGWVAMRVASPDEASLHTETLGSVVDRLAIAWVRAQQLMALPSGSRDRARLALRQLSELADAYDDLVRDVIAGQRRLPSWRPLKTYGMGR